MQSFSVGLLLLLLGQSLAMAPGDEDDVCGVLKYPVHFRVLMDSWRYQKLLPPESGDTTVSAWATINDGGESTNIVCCPCTCMYCRNKRHIYHCSGALKDRVQRALFHYVLEVQETSG